TLDGAPVKAGTVTFTGDGKKITTASIRDDGTYQMDNPPLGSVKVSVVGGQASGNIAQKMDPKGPIPNPEEIKGQGAAARPQAMQLPPAYATATTTPLSTTIEAGTKEFDIPL